MKRFFNLATCAMLAVIVIAIVAAVLSPTINWLAVVWMVITAMWVVSARLNQLTAEDWKQLYDTQSKTFNTLRQTWASTNDELAELRGKYQTVVQDLDAATQKVEELTRALEAKKTIRKMTRKNKEDYTDQERARIKNEMKSEGLAPEKED